MQNVSYKFEKYHGTGNDFIMIDDRSETFPETDSGYIQDLCSRRFGIGADGLILIRQAMDADFEMVYFNADGNPGSMCGNGGRCAVAYAYKMGICGAKNNFLAYDGIHKGTIHPDGSVSISMKSPDVIQMVDNDHYMLDTGSPHYIIFTEQDPGRDFTQKALSIRNLPQYKEKGINVNFIFPGESEQMYIRTFERGVEGETFSCGTGVTAGAIAISVRRKSQCTGSVTLYTPGGKLQVSFQKKEGGKYENVVLRGPAVYVFSGTM